MANGTINLVNNSTALTGVGSKFLTELTPGDFIYVEVGTVPYTLPVDKINSDTSITLLRKFTGPTINGVAWTLIPRRAQNSVASALADQVAEAIRLSLNNENNWQKLLTESGNVTITRPDGSTYTGPSWISILDGVPDIVSKGISWDSPTNAGLAVGTAVIRADISSGSDLYIKIARVKMAQSADTIGIRLLGGSGFNVGSPGQACVHDIILRTANNNPFSINPVCIVNAHTNFNSAIQAVYAVHESGNIWQIWIKAVSVYMTGLTMQVCCPPNSSRTEVLEFGRLGSSATEPENAITNQTWRNVSVSWGSGGFTVDSNGFVKTASPILKIKAANSDCGDAFSSGAIYHDDIYAANAECEGVQAVKTDVGRYEITGAEGLADDGWQMEIPQDNNGNRLCFVETSYADGVLTVQVSKKAFDAGSGNFVAGEPMEVPSGRWIDIRLSVPNEGEVTAPDGAGIEIK